MKRKSLLFGGILSIVALSMFVAVYAFFHLMMFDLGGLPTMGAVINEENLIWIVLPAGVAVLGILFSAFSLSVGFKDNTKFSKMKWIVVIAVLLNLLMTAFFIYRIIQVQEMLNLMIVYIAAASAAGLSSIFLFGACFYSKHIKKQK